MSNKTLTVGLIAVAIIAVVGWFVPAQQAPGAGGTRFANGISADSTSPSAGQVRGTTLLTTAAATIGTTASVASSSPSSMGDVVISSAGTTTLMLGSTVAAKGTCFQMLNSAGALTQVYINGTSFVLAAGSCK